MNIKEAKICLDCDEIYDDEISFCPNCGGRIGWLLRDWIGTIGKEAPRAEFETPITDLMFSERSEKVRPNPALFFIHRE